MMFWNWKCFFCRLTAWFLKCYPQKIHQDLLMWQYERGGTWVGVNGIPWSSVFILAKLMYQTWRAFFRCWLGGFPNTVIFDIIFLVGNFILMQHMFDNCDELVKFWVKLIHFVISIFLVGINWSSCEEEPVIQTWYIDISIFCVCCCDKGLVLTIVE